MIWNDVKSLFLFVLYKFCFHNLFFLLYCCRKRAHDQFHYLKVLLSKLSEYLNRTKPLQVLMFYNTFMTSKNVDFCPESFIHTCHMSNPVIFSSSVMKNEQQEHNFSHDLSQYWLFALFTSENMFLLFSFLWEESACCKSFFVLYEMTTQQTCGHALLQHAQHTHTQKASRCGGLKGAQSAVLGPWRLRPGESLWEPWYYSAGLSYEGKPAC